MRDYANIITAIWRDPAFRALKSGPQRTYLMLVTQEDISGAGTLDLTLRRWASNAPDTTPEGIDDDLVALEAAGFAYTDHDTEEVLIRTFVKHDKGYNNPKRRPVILTAANMVRSLNLRHILWAELAKLGLADSLPPLPDPSTDSQSDRRIRPTFRDVPETVAGAPPDGIDKRLSSQGNSLSDVLPDRASSQNRVVVTAVGTDTSTLNPQTVPPSAGATAPRAELAIVPDPGPEPRTAQEIVAWWIDGCDQRPDRSTIGQISKHIKGLLEQDFQPVHIRRGITEWAAKELHPATLPSIVSHAANRAAPIRAAPRSTTDSRVLDALELANRQEARGGTG